MSHAKPSCVFTIDVEDWFHVLDLPSTPPLADWDLLPGSVEPDFLRMLDILESSGIRATCFFLGWIARRYPHLVRAAQLRGHEIASHGYSHRLAHHMGPAEFRADAALARDILEQCSGERVLGFRCPGFSLTPATEWVFDELIGAGYAYDASVFPASRAHGGWPGQSLLPSRILRPAGSLVEFPMTVARLAGREFCFFGGGYLRLFPISLVESMTARVLAENRPVIFYVHPREINPAQPRLPMSRWRRFKTYVNLAGTETKLRRIVSLWSFTTLAELGRPLGLPAPAPASLEGVRS